MNRTKQKNAGIGVGYVTVMIIFAVLCLTIFAVLSFRAAGSNDALNSRAGNYLKEYYEADMSAKEMLFKLDEIACQSRSSLFFSESFETAAEEIEGVTVKNSLEGCTAEFIVEVNDRQSIYASVTFFEDRPQYRIDFWKSVTSSFDDDHGLNVWDGTFN